MHTLKIILGSAMGGTEQVANYVAANIKGQFAESTKVLTSANAKDLTEDSGAFLLFMTANTGSGDLPDNILPLYTELKTMLPNIAHRKYALINFGDSSYPTFGQAGHTLTEALKGVGANEIVEPLLIDGSSERYPQITVLEWVKGVLERLDN